MDYIGCKEKLNDFLFSKINKNISDPDGVEFLDACAGTGAVAQRAAKHGYKVIANDLMKASCVSIEGMCMPAARLSDGYQHLETMNNLSGVEGFFYHNYCENGGRLFFTDENAKKIDAMRLYIDTVSDKEIRPWLMASLLEGMNSVSNTAASHEAFLKQYKSRALRPLKLSNTPIISYNNITVYNRDLLELLTDPQYRAKHKEKVIYIDPPYNHRQYGSFYHLYETLVRYDAPEISGVAGKRVGWQDDYKSDFCSKKTCLEYFKKALEASTASLIFISYSSDGLVSRDDFERFCYEMDVDKKGVSLHMLPYKRFKADSSDDREYNNKQLVEYMYEINR